LVVPHRRQWDRSDDRQQALTFIKQITDTVGVDHGGLTASDACQIFS
jgi:hypothetical protein